MERRVGTPGEWSWWRVGVRDIYPNTQTAVSMYIERWWRPASYIIESESTHRCRRDGLNLVFRSPGSNHRPLCRFVSRVQSGGWRTKSPRSSLQSTELGRRSHYSPHTPTPHGDGPDDTFRRGPSTCRRENRTRPVLFWEPLTFTLVET